jgi:hypothetical protein
VQIAGYRQPVDLRLDVMHRGSAGQRVVARDPALTSPISGLKIVKISFLVLPQLFFMTMDKALNQRAVLELINSKTHKGRVEWTSRLILHELGIPPSKSRRASCTRTLRQLWKQGKLRRKAARRDNLETVYCRLDVPLSEYCVPCEICSFPVYVRGQSKSACRRCDKEVIGNGDPAKMFLK